MGSAINSEVKMKSLKRQLSRTILIVLLLTIAITSISANYFIHRQFANYISHQQELKTQVITSSISNQYSSFTGRWNLDFIYAIGMSSLYEGYIIKVFDENNQVLWDAQSHNMSLCNQIMNDISNRMKIQYPQVNGEFKAVNYPLMLEGEKVGSVDISYFGPFFLNENDFRFLRSLNTILISIGIASLAVSAIAGQMLAGRISRPILKTVDVTRQISDGNYGVRLTEETNTKELNLLVASINHLAEALETMERLRKQLTEDVAHELRTPITILASYLEAMAEGVWASTPERLQSCYDEVMRIGKLVGDLEKLARIEGDNLKLDKQKVDLRELVEKLVHSFDAEMKNKGLAAAVEGDYVSLMADQDRLSQVIANLLSNAVKYSREGGAIKAVIFDQGNFAGFSIRDNGIGIPKEELPYIFERFYRADQSRNRATGGSGIGLTIAKSIVEAHGGKITAESSVDEGSRFTVIIPKASDNNA